MKTSLIYIVRRSNTFGQSTFRFGKINNKKNSSFAPNKNAIKEQNSIDKSYPLFFDIFF